MPSPVDFELAAPLHLMCDSHERRRRVLRPLNDVLNPRDNFARIKTVWKYNRRLPARARRLDPEGAHCRAHAAGDAIILFTFKSAWMDITNIGVTREFGLYSTLRV
jgi:hypothetical protein